jgi:hypothetical protein
MSRPGLWQQSDFLKLWTGQTVSQIRSAVSSPGIPLTALYVRHAPPRPDRHPDRLDHGTLCHPHPRDFVPVLSRRHRAHPKIRTQSDAAPEPPPAPRHRRRHSGVLEPADPARPCPAHRHSRLLTRYVRKPVSGLHREGSPHVRRPCRDHHFRRRSRQFIRRILRHPHGPPLRPRPTLSGASVTTGVDNMLVPLRTRFGGSLRGLPAASQNKA